MNKLYYRGFKVSVVEFSKNVSIIIFKTTQQDVFVCLFITCLYQLNLKKIIEITTRVMVTT